MLELLFQGFIEWIYGLILKCWEYFASVLFDLMSLDFAYLREHMPVIDTIRQIMLGVGWALLIGNLVFQATRGMAAGLGFDAEDPKLLFTRTFAFSFLLVASPQICELGLNMTSTVIELLQMPDAVDITFADEASFGGLTGSWLLVVICGIIVMFQTFKLISLSQIVLAALPEQVEAVLNRRYRETGKARVFTITDAALRELLGSTAPYTPPDLPFYTSEGSVLDVPPLKAP